MNLKNITLKVAELGPVKWEDVEKLQPAADGGYSCFVSYYTEEFSELIDGEEVISEKMFGEYIHTNFDHKPSYKEMINYIIQKEYPDGKEAQMLRLGIYDPQNSEYLEYYSHAEEIKNEIKNLLS